MRQPIVSLEWQHDPLGYRLIDAVSPAPPPQPVHPVFPPDFAETRLRPDYSRPQRIVRRGGQLVPHRPLSQFGSLFKIFANTAVDAQSLLDFVEKFGPLTSAGFKTNAGDPVPQILEHASAMREFLANSSGDRIRRVERIAIQQGGVTLTGMTVKFSLDMETRFPSLWISPRSLLDALWLQLWQALSGSVAMQKCLHCSQWFETGPGTGRRAGAKFCSDKHKIIFHSMQRSKRG